MTQELTSAPRSKFAYDKVRPCPACGAWTTDAKRRGGYGSGPAPRLCPQCQADHPGERWCKRCEQFELSAECPVTVARRAEKSAGGKWALDKVSTCPACGTESTDFERRGGKYAQGPAPRLCIECQRAHPDERWCDRCEAFESTRRCPEYLAERDERLRASGKYRSTAEVTCGGCGRSGLASELRPGASGPFRLCAACIAAEGDELLQCPSCKDYWPRREYFAGHEQRTGRKRSTKYTPCLDCRNAHSDEQWCFNHQMFEPATAFGGWSTRSCAQSARDRRLRYDPDVLLAIHGTVEGQCMCCFRPIGRSAATDHDHSHCAGSRGCEECIRGLICSQCNNVEGLVRTLYGPPYPRLIQEYLDRFEAFRVEREAMSM